ncbi:MAG: selenocysteine-specific translation elongation factor [Chloroflexi bacterium]|nr:selenocysteine-specific translation elongation factor [Chloroflexota bacterium]
MFVVGTSGHVDHGKSTLIHALTGIDPDRLEEEKRRGMTIDLGFAWLTLPSGKEVSIVDVPGHESFVHNMLAGVGSLDVALLIVAADESVMPQTQEHVAILDLLHIARGLVVLTKRDLVDDELLGLVQEEVADVLMGTSLEGAPMVPVSAVTREGLDTLLATLDRLLDETPARKDLGRPRLPVDRAFSVAGFGTVVTGTLIDGMLRVGQEVEVLPGGLSARIRGLQTHRHKVDPALPGTRVAANLAGVAVDQVHRGDVVTASGWLRPSPAVDVQLRLLRDAGPPLEHASSLTLHAGTAEVTCRVRLLDSDELTPGATAWAQLVLAQPLPLVKGDFFVVRAGNRTLGGGQVVETNVRRHRRFHRATLERLSALSQAVEPRELVLQSLSTDQPVELEGLAQLAHLGLDEAATAVQALATEGQVVLLGDEIDNRALVYSSVAWHNLAARMRQELEAYHRQSPLRLGMPREEVRSRLKLPSRTFDLAMPRLVASGAVAEAGPRLRLSAHQPRLTPQQQAQIQAYLGALEASPLSPPPDSALDPQILGLLIEEGKVVKVAEGVVFTGAAYDAMVGKVVAEIRAKGSITVAQVRDLLGTSRKYALALMEYLDQQKVTRRLGDERILRS